MSINIKELIDSGAQVAITTTPTDLKEFAMAIIAEQNELSQKKPQRVESFMTPDEVAVKLGVTKNTLWRWNKQEYLSPIKIGHKSLYRNSDVERLMSGQQ